MAHTLPGLSRESLVSCTDSRSAPHLFAREDPPAGRRCPPALLPSPRDRRATGPPRARNSPARPRRSPGRSRRAARNRTARAPRRPTSGRTPRCDPTGSAPSRELRCERPSVASLQQFDSRIPLLARSQPELPLNPRCVVQILRTSGSFLVLQEVGHTQDRYSDSVDLMVFASVPSFFEQNTVDRGEHVDAIAIVTDLEDQSGPGEL